MEKFGPHILILFVLTALALAPACSEDDTPTQATDPRDTIPDAEVLWSIGSAYTPLCYANGKIFGGFEGGITARDASNGNQLWHKQTHDLIYGTPAATAARVCYVCRDSYVYGLDATSGIQCWQYSPGTYSVCLSAYNNVLYIASEDSSLTAIDLATGDEHWRFTSTHEIRSKVVEANGIVYFGNVAGDVFAVDTQTKLAIWESSVKNAIEVRPAVSDNAVFIVDDEGVLHALEGNTGTALWTFDKDGAELSAPAVANNIVVVGSRNNRVYALQATTGEELWSFDAGRPVLTDAVISENIVYCCTDNTLYTLDLPTGRAIYKHKVYSDLPSNSYITTPVVDNGIVYFSSISRCYAITNP